MSFRVGGALALIAAVLLAVSIATSAWWSGPPTVNGKEHISQTISIGLLGGEGCNSAGEDNKCVKILLGGGFKTISGIELGAASLATLLCLALAGMTLTGKPARRRLARPVLAAGAVATLLAVALAATGPDMIKAPGGTTVPLGYGALFGMIGSMAAIAAGLLAVRDAPVPRAAAPFAAGPPMMMPVAAPAIAMRAADPVGPGGMLAGPAGPLQPMSAPPPPPPSPGAPPLFAGAPPPPAPRPFGLPNVGGPLSVIAPVGRAASAIAPVGYAQAPLAAPPAALAATVLAPPPAAPPPRAAKPSAPPPLRRPPPPRPGASTAPPPSPAATRVATPSRPMPPLPRTSGLAAPPPSLPPPLQVPTPPGIPASPLTPAPIPQPSILDEDDDADDASATAIREGERDADSEDLGATSERRGAPSFGSQPFSAQDDSTSPSLAPATDDAVGDELETLAVDRVSAPQLGTGQTAPVQRTSSSVVASSPRPPDVASTAPSEVVASTSTTDAQIVVPPPDLDPDPAEAPFTDARTTDTQPSEPAPAASPPITTAPALPAPRESQVVMPKGPSPACPQCDAPMAWVEEHLRFYCKSCKMYF